MKKLNYLFSTAALMVALVLASCSAQDLPVDPNAPKIHDGDDLAQAIAQYTEVVNGVPTLTLPAGVTVNLNEAVELGFPLTIKGDEENYAKIILGAEGKFVGTSIQLENVNIDALQAQSPLVTLAAADAAEWTESYVTFKNFVLAGLNKALVFSGAKNYVTSIIVDNANVQITSDVTVFDFTKGSFPLVLDIDKTTFWAPKETTKAFFSTQGGQKANEMEGGEEIFNFKSSTFYNLTKNKNFFSHRQSNQTWLTYKVKDCIFVNCGKSGQVIKGMNGGQSGKNPTWDISGNVFNYDGADTSADESTADEDEPVKDSKAVVVKFADPDAGIFMQTDVEAGDPMWYAL